VFFTDYTGYVIVGSTPAGGVKQPDKYPGGIEVKWVSDSKYGRHRDVDIEYGVNLKSLTVETNMDEFCTRVYPVGALLDTGERVDIKNAARPEHTQGLAYIDIDETQYIQQHGVRSVVQEWSDVTDPDNLYDNAKAWLSANNAIKKCYSATVLDLSVIGTTEGSAENRFRCGDYHYIVHPDMYVETEVQIIGIVYDLAQLQNVEITLGDKVMNMAEQNRQSAVRVKEYP
jgi:phage minor structural protein